LYEEFSQKLKDNQEKISGLEREKELLISKCSGLEE